MSKCLNAACNQIIVSKKYLKFYTDSSSWLSSFTLLTGFWQAYRLQRYSFVRAESGLSLRSGNSGVDWGADCKILRGMKIRKNSSRSGSKLFPTIAISGIPWVRDWLRMDHTPNDVGYFVETFCIPPHNLTALSIHSSLSNTMPR